MLLFVFYDNICPSLSTMLLDKLRMIECFLVDKKKKIECFLKIQYVWFEVRDIAFYYILVCYYIVYGCYMPLRIHTYVECHYIFWKSNHGDIL